MILAVTLPVTRLMIAIGFVILAGRLGVFDQQQIDEMGKSKHRESVGIKCQQLALSARCENAHAGRETRNLKDDEKRDGNIEWENPVSTADVEYIVRTGDEKVLEAPHEEAEC